MIPTTLAAFHGAPVAVGLVELLPLPPAPGDEAFPESTPGVTFVGESTARGFTMGAWVDVEPEPDALG